ncbi:MAG: flagellar hook-associated protein 3 [Deltaproteobacteria bacterium]|nr:flagellar hook-associated protein 3 [Deltaproteobacteria bacterium]TLN04802.1 MAG: flagellar hook-associated protein 3 [bacterium]
MRITPGMTSDNALYNLQKGRTLLNRLQEQIASGSLINRPSDDPITTRQLLDMDSKLDSGEQYLSNITKGNLSLSLTDTALQGMADIIAQVKKTAGAITSGSSDQTVRENAASQLEELKKQLVDLGNTQLGDQFIFAGFKNSTPPFSMANNDYSGTSDELTIEIDRNSPAGITIAGDALLKGTGSYGGVDMLETLDKIITAIRDNIPADIQENAKLLDSSANQINNARSDVAGRMIRFKSAETMISRNQSTLQGIVSDTMGVDYIKAATELTQQQASFEAALSATAKITQLSLLDYL